MALTILDPAFKACQAKMKGVQYAKLDDVKDVNTMTTSNFVTLDRTKRCTGGCTKNLGHAAEGGANECQTNIKMTNETCFGDT